jgi:hypothetical protein
MGYKSNAIATCMLKFDKIDSQIDGIAMTMQLKCPKCGKKARIDSSHEISDSVRRIDCQCLNSTFCGVTWVELLNFSHFKTEPVDKSFYPKVPIEQIEIFN